MTSAVSQKRKRSSKNAATKSTNQKRQRVAVPSANLTWKRVSTKSMLANLGDGATFDDDEMGGLMEMEEIEGVTVEYGQDKTVKFLVSDPSLALGDGDASESASANDEEEWIPASMLEEQQELPESTVSTAKPQAEAGTQSIASLNDSELPEDCPESISSLPVMLPFKHAFLSMGFTTPTPIQSSAWSTAFSPEDNTIAQRDIIGIAQTGSGKTLAYGLPILQSCLTQAPIGLRALILTPTRELALQVKSHLVAFQTASLLPEHQDPKKYRQPINILALTGGMSIHKQRRQLSYQPQIIVATPGRLWDLMQEDETGLSDSIKGIGFLVLDEADRMVESGHYAELEKVFRLLKREEEEGFKNEFGEAVQIEEAAEEAAEKKSDDFKTYVFSATMSKELQKNLKKPRHKRAKIREGQKGSMGALGDLMEAIDFRDPEPEVICLTDVGSTISSLKECSIECLITEKDMHLYHFLLRYPGKTLVFLSSIDGIRRLHPLFSVLNLGEIGLLHSGMQQKARLKALDRFTNSSHATSVLLCTDVAARGLDIPSVHHVVHYQLPRSADTYVHRSGRTARAGKEGVVLQLVSPEEKGLQRELFKSLNRDVKDLSELPVEWSIMDRLKHRIDLARQIENANHKVTKANHEEKWLREAAEAMEIDLDNVESDDERVKLRGPKTKAKVAGLKAELAAELAKPMMRHGISAKYITAGTGGQAGFADSMLNQSSHSTFIGATQTNAHGDAQPAKLKKKQKRQQSGKL